ncbi:MULTISPECIES: hypothetical protein [unclassified Sphingomonas]|uniref:hypothetical protein n=1 Tax=unclassified Sphingomonas TaxID=196159 RepID=UPI00268C96D3
MQAGLWAGAGIAVAIALFSGWRDWRRARRADPDAVSMIDWPTVQILALIAAVVMAGLALKG